MDEVLQKISPRQNRVFPSRPPVSDFRAILTRRPFVRLIGKFPFFCQKESTVRPVCRWIWGMRYKKTLDAVFCGVCFCPAFRSFYKMPMEKCLQFYRKSFRLSDGGIEDCRS